MFRIAIDQQIGGAVECPQRGKHHQALLERDGEVSLTVDDKHGSVNAVRCEEWRVLDVTVAISPRSAGRARLPGLDRPNVTVAAVTPGTEKIAGRCTQYGGSENIRMRNQEQAGITAETSTRDPEPARGQIHGANCIDRGDH